MELNAVTKSVNDLFNAQKKYVVPRFQREYSWKQEQVKDLWDDIVSKISIQNKSIINEEYFIGCIVLIGDDTSSKMLIVDGQQRLTTLTILLSSIVKRFTELNQLDSANALQENVIEGKDNDGKKYFKFVSESPKPFFQNEIQAITPESQSCASTTEELLIEKNYKFFKKCISSYKLDGLNEIKSLVALREQVLKYLKVILITAKDEDDAYTIFETLNARGMSLSSVNLIKNWIFKNYKQEHPNDNAKTNWETIRQNTTEPADLEEFFRHHWNSKYNSSSDANLYKSFKKSLINKVIIDAKSFIDELKHSSETYRTIILPTAPDSTTQKEKSVYKSLELLNQYKIKLARPLLLSALELRKKNKINETNLIKLVTNIEKFHFIVSKICQSRASGLEGKYGRTARQLYKASNKKEIIDIINELNNDLIKKMPNATNIIDSLGKIELTESKTTYKKVIQTIFSKIEFKLSGEVELYFNSLSIEHICDQSSIHKNNWNHKIGNLLPLAEKINNGIGKNINFKDKINHYKNSSLKTVELFLDTFKNEQEWSAAKSQQWKELIGNKLSEATKLSTFN